MPPRRTHKDPVSHIRRYLRPDSTPHDWINTSPHHQNTRWNVTSYSERWKPRSYHLQKVPPNLDGIYDNATSVIYDASFIEFSSRIVACFIAIDGHVFAKANVSICLFILLWQVATRTHTGPTIEQIQRPVSEDWPLTRHVDDVDMCLTCNNAASTRIYLQSVAWIWLFWFGAPLTFLSRMRLQSSWSLYKSPVHVI